MSQPALRPLGKFALTPTAEIPCDFLLANVLDVIFCRQHPEIAREFLLEIGRRFADPVEVARFMRRPLPEPPRGVLVRLDREERIRLLKRRLVELDSSLEWLL